MNLHSRSRAILFLSLIAIFTLVVTEVQAQAPAKMSYQGKLADSSGNPISNGTYNIKFSIYDAVNSGTAIWDETQGVSVQDGHFNILLGDINALNIAFDKAYWLGVKVDSDPEMTPRTPLSSAPYSLHARSIANNSVTNSKILNNTIDPSKLKQGNDGQVLTMTGANPTWTDAVIVPQMIKWETTDDNTSSNLTAIDHPDLNGNPGAMLTVTHNYTGQYIQAIGVWYSNARNKWTIYTEDVSEMPSNQDFFVTFVK